MKRHKQYIWATIAVVLFLIGGCQTKEIIDENETETGQLHFSPTLGGAETATRAAESDNGVLQTASAANASSSHIVINTYTGVPGTSLKEYFSDKLGYFDSRKCWDVTSENKRFLPTGGMNLYAYFATNRFKEADLAKVTYIHPTADTDHPKLTFTVAEAEEGAFSQVDLVAAKVVGITSPNVSIPLRHILSQINFGVKGMDQHKIKVTNIRITKVKGEGSFDYNTWQWTPNADTEPLTYPYYFPDRIKDNEKSGWGDTYTTPGDPDDSQNSYLFGDGGKFGPGEEDTFLYAQVNPSPSNYATKANTPKDAPLNNSLMLLPQKIKENKEATVTFDYEVKLGDQTIRTATGNVVRLDAYYDWEPNMRYVYLFKFDNPEKVTFDVLLEPWVESPGNIETDELSSAYLFQKYVQPIKPSGSYSVPIGPLTEDFICDWSLFTLSNDFVKDNTFTLTFDELPFKYKKSVIINPPFGFTASVASLSAPGTVTFTATHSYYSTSETLNSAISSGSGNYEFNVSDAIKLEDVKFSGSETAESSLTLHYPTSYTGTPLSRWQLSGETAICYPKDYALTSTASPYTYTIYTVQGLEAVFNWMNNGGNNPGGSNSTPDIAVRMKTNINLVANGKYNFADVYKAGNSATDLKPVFVPIGNYTTSYSGTFDGKGATLENLFINTTNNIYQGLFGNVSGRVQFINLKNASIYSGDWNVGGIAASNNGTIVGCSVSGSIHGGSAGGIVGENNGFVYSCASTAVVTKTGAAGHAGGIAGVTWTTVQGCYSTSSGVNIVGGGTLEANIGKCFYVATSDVGTNPTNVTRVPSIAALNGKIPELSLQGATLWTGAHFVSGNLNATPPSIAPGDPDGRLNGGVLKGTFIQNSYALSWPQERWDEEMAVLATLGMEYLVLDQVMEFSDYAGNNQYMSWYPASPSVLVNDNLPINANLTDIPLEKCMKACSKHGIKLFIGTFFDKRYWDGGIAVATEGGKKQEWYNCITTANRVMAELITKYFHDGNGSYKDVLAGWYFPYEVDDYSFQTPEAQKILKEGMKTAMTYRNGLSGNAKKPYLFSPFMNGSGPYAIKEPTMNATQYAALWEGIIKDTGFQNGDILSPQDCIGTGKFLISDIHDWMPKLREVAKAKGVEFWVNVELFEPYGSASNVSDLTGKQIPASNAYATKLISFSYPIHYSPSSNRQGDHKAYKAYYDAQ